MSSRAPLFISDLWFAEMNSKGELSSAQIDRDWPFQVALSADFFSANHGTVESARRVLGACSRGHTVRYQDVDYVVTAFKTQEAADTFRERFNGEPFDPKHRGRGASWWKWNKPDTAAKG